MPSGPPSSAARCTSSDLGTTVTGSLVVAGGSVLTDAGWRDGTVTVVDGVVTDGPAPRGTPVLGASGCLVAPGLVDLQCNGAVGIHLSDDPTGVWDVGASLPAHGVTAWLPTIVTAAAGVVEQAIEVLAGGPPPGWRGAVPLGLHLEGPFLAPDAAGAHPVELLRRPDVDVARRWSDSGVVALVTLAPELDGAVEVIRALRGSGVAVSLGHTRATVEQFGAAVDAGAGMVTHLFNAMSGLHHRDLGVAGAALSDERVAVGLIADGAHVDRRVVGIAARALGERLVLVSDAVALLGDPAASADVGARLPDGTLAGSVLSLVDAVRNLVDWTGCAPHAALAAATTRPAAVIGVSDRGHLAPGAVGDLVVLGPDLDLRSTVVAGQLVHHV